MYGNKTFADNFGGSLQDIDLESESNPRTLQNEEDDDIHKFLPIAVVGKIMKDALTPMPAIMKKDMGLGNSNLKPGKDQLSAKISKEAKETMQECLTEFILFLTSEAWELCEQNERKTILGSDLIFAMERLDFAYFGDILNKLLQKYKMSQKIREINTHKKKTEVEEQKHRPDFGDHDPED